MRSRPLLAAVCLCLAPAPARAQTEEIQQEVETRLWFERLYQSFGIAGLPPLVGILTLLAALIAVAAAIWLWRSRRRPPPEDKS
jgi:hypothetical protein